MPKKCAIFIIIACLLVFTGCSNKQNAENIKPENHEKIGSRQVNQNIAKQAVDQVLKMNQVTDAVAVNSQKEIFLAYKIKHLARFHMERIEKDVKQELKKQFPDYNITVSSDLKLFLETTKLTKRTKNESMDHKQIKNGLKELKKLKNEKT